LKGNIYRKGATPMEGMKFDSMSITVTQEENTLTGHDGVEQITIDMLTQLPGEDHFFVIKTDQWSFDSPDELNRLIQKLNDIRNVFGI
jgi:hypothetical protein